MSEQQADQPQGEGGSETIPGLCYVICDLTPTIKNRCKLHELTAFLVIDSELLEGIEEKLIGKAEGKARLELRAETSKTLSKMDRRRWDGPGCRLSRSDILG